MHILGSWLRLGMDAMHSDEDGLKRKILVIYLWARV